MQPRAQLSDAEVNILAIGRYWGVLLSSSYGVGVMVDNLQLTVNVFSAQSKYPGIHKALQSTYKRPVEKRIVFALGNKMYSWRECG